MNPLRITLGIGIAALALTAGGPAASGAKDAPAAGPGEVTTSATAAAKKKRGPKLKIADSDYGPILFNGRGRALYLFTSDSGKRSNCSGDCAVAWPPYIVKAKPVAGKGVKPGLIGTTRRADGRLQATYGGHPIYFYEGDTKPGQVFCQAVYEFGGFWYVLKANGKAVR
jgi:predicted lipoprotein with Yx(FWY)xxD motif